MQFGARTFTCIILLAGLVAAAYFYVFKPMGDYNMALQTQTRDKQEKLASLHNAEDKKRDLPGEIAKLKTGISMFESKLPEERELDKAWRDVWQIAETNGLSTKSVRTMKPILGNDYSEQPIRMTITGTWNGFYSFLRSVEGLQRLTRISEMSLNKDMKDNGALTAEFTLSIFFDSSGRGRQVAEAQ
jgi:type IV pilus assembly protein PilO